jgi:hypothetical protein
VPIAINSGKLKTRAIQEELDIICNSLPLKNCKGVRGAEISCGNSLDRNKEVNATIMFENSNIEKMRKRNICITFCRDICVVDCVLSVANESFVAKKVSTIIIKDIKPMAKSRVRDLTVLLGWNQ